MTTNQMDNLTQICLALPNGKKARLIRTLMRSLKEKDQLINKRFDILYKAATAVCGPGILSKFRNRELVIGRNMIAYKMRNEGFSSPTIGKLLQKNHATILNQASCMESALKYQFQPDISMWNDFLNKVEEYEKEISSQVV